jgi:hypothetical protein
VINDNSPGTYLTYGKFDPVISMDDMYHAELVIYAHVNPAYTQIPRSAHRHRGAVSRHRDRARGAGLQPVAHARRLLRAGAARDRCGVRPRHGAGDHRRGALQREIRQGADGPAAARAARQPAFPARVGHGRERARRPVLRWDSKKNRRRPCRGRWRWVLAATYGRAIRAIEDGTAVSSRCSRS